MLNKLFLKIVAVIVAVTFMYSNLIWADGMAVHKLAAQSQAGVIGRIVMTDMEALEKAVSLAKQHVLTMAGLVRLGISKGNFDGKTCLISNDDKETAYYFFEKDKSYYCRVTTAEEVADILFLLLQKIGVSVPGDILPSKKSGKIYYEQRWSINPGQEKILESFSNIIYGESGNNISSVPVGESGSKEKPVIKPVGPQTGEEGISTIGTLALTGILSGIGVLIYTFRSQIWVWISAVSFGGNVFSGLIIAGLLIGLYFFIRHISSRRSESENADVLYRKPGIDIDALVAGKSVKQLACLLACPDILKSGPSDAVWVTQRIYRAVVKKLGILVKSDIKEEERIEAVHLLVDIFHTSHLRGYPISGQEAAEILAQIGDEGIKELIRSLGWHDSYVAGIARQILLEHGYILQASRKGLVNPKHVVVNIKVGKYVPMYIAKKVQTGEEGISTIGTLALTGILSGIGVLIYTFRSQIWVWISAVSFGGNVFGGLIIAGLLIGLYFYIRHIVFSVSRRSVNRVVDHPVANREWGERKGITTLRQLSPENYDGAALEYYITKGTEQERTEAIKILCQVKDKQWVSDALDLLIEVISEKNTDIRGRVLSTIRRLEFPDAYGFKTRDKLYIPLINHIYREGNLREYLRLIYLLKEVGREDTTVVPVLTRFIFRDPLYYGDNKYTLSAIDALNEVGGKLAIPIFKAKLIYLQRTMYGYMYTTEWGKIAQEEEIGKLKNLLGNMEHEIQLPTLERMDNRDISVLRVLYLIGKEGMYGELYHIAVGDNIEDEDGVMRSTAMDLLKILADDNFINDVEKAMERDLLDKHLPEEDIQKVVRLLAKLGSDKVMDYIVAKLLPLLQSKTDWEQEKAIDELHNLGYRCQDTPEGLIGVKKVLVSEFRTGWSHTDYIPSLYPSRGRFTQQPYFGNVYKGLVTKYIGKPASSSRMKQSQYIRKIREAEKEVNIIKMDVDHLGKISNIEVTGDLTKLAEILDVELTEAIAVVMEILQEAINEAAKESGVGIYGAVKQILLVDNLGGLESMVRKEKGAAAVLQDGRVLVDIDAFRTKYRDKQGKIKILNKRQVLKDVVKHELWESILELLEANDGVCEITAIYQNLRDFVGLSLEEQSDLILFLSDRENGLYSEEYAQLLQYIVNNNVTGDGLIALAINYVTTTPRYGHLKESLKGILSSNIKEAGEKLRLAELVYTYLIQAVEGLAPIIVRVKSAEANAKVIMKVKMIVSRLPVIEVGFVDALVSNRKFIKLDADELMKDENSHIVKWLQNIAGDRSQENTPFVFYGDRTSELKDKGLESAILPKGCKVEDVIDLLDLGKGQPEDVGDSLCLPLVYSITGIYLAKEVVMAGGNIDCVEDKLARSTLENLYETLFGKRLTSEEWIDLFAGRIWPPNIKITETLITLRTAIAEIEKAA